jgi:hypothetical protein
VGIEQRTRDVLNHDHGADPSRKPARACSVPMESERGSRFLI